MTFLQKGFKLLQSIFVSVFTVVMNDLGTYALDSFVVCYIILGGIVYMYVQGGVIHH